MKIDNILGRNVQVQTTLPVSLRLPGESGRRKADLVRGKVVHVASGFLTLETEDAIEHGDGSCFPIKTTLMLPIKHLGSIVVED